MKLLYLDSNDIANLGDGKYGDDTIVRLKDALDQAGASLAVSHFHIIEAVGSDVGEARWRRILDAGIEAEAFVGDVRDHELVTAATTLGDATAQTHAPRVPLRLVIDVMFADARAHYDELRSIHRGTATASFLSIQGDDMARKPDFKSYDKKVVDLLAEIDTVANRLDGKITAAKVRGVDLGASVRNKRGAGVDKLFQENLGHRLDDVIEAQRSAMVAMLREPNPAAESAAQIRGFLRDANIELKGKAKNLKVGQLMEVSVICQRAAGLGVRFAYSDMERLLVNRIPHVLDYYRRRDPNRMTEVGDELDGDHLTYLPFVSLMTADGRTVNWIKQTKLPKLLAVVKRLSPGGSRELFDAVLKRLDTAIDLADPMPSPSPA